MGDDCIPKDGLGMGDVKKKIFYCNNCDPSRNTAQAILIPSPPKAWSRARINGKNFFTAPKTLAAKREIQSALAKAQQKRIPKPIALSVSIYFFLEKPKSNKNKYPITRPDLDNYVKLILDAGNMILWDDDSQVVSIEARKHYCEASELARIELVIQKLD